MITFINIVKVIISLQFFLRVHTIYIFLPSFLWQTEIPTVKTIALYSSESWTMIQRDRERKKSILDVVLGKNGGYQLDRGKTKEKVLRICTILIKREAY